MTGPVTGSVLVTSRSFATSDPVPRHDLEAAGLAVVRADARHDPDELARLLPAAGYEIEELGERELVLRYTDEASAREELERAGWLGAADIGGGGPVVLHQRLSYAIARAGV